MRQSSRVSLLSLFSLSLGDDTRDDVSLKPNSISQTFFVGTSIKWGQSVLQHISSFDIHFFILLGLVG